ncbi:hypothetical protein ACIQ6V_09460 [Streptomyces sp. NPDC096198]|uniref:hypothetical protein n=1 Tax=Streptomyces sp. NPDC096198 TaxID=3366080 RepID=UPI0037FBCED8
MPRFTDFDFGVSWVMGFFHQDATHYGDTAADIVAHHLAEWIDESAVAVRRDAEVLGHLSSETLEVLWDAGTDYLPGPERIGGEFVVDNIRYLVEQDQ